MQPLKETLCHKLDYLFKNLELLEAALTHRSVHGENNERLEFLGDSIVNFIIANTLFHRYPQAREGELSRMRASLVKGETLAELAHELELGNYLRLGTGELKSGGYRRKSILADAMEAVIAAIYLDGGMVVCEERVLAWYATRLDELTNTTLEKDPKTRLQEYLQAKKITLPVYNVTSIDGRGHEQIFHVSCKIKAFAYVANGSSANRRNAEQEAAQNFLDHLKNE